MPELIRSLAAHLRSLVGNRRRAKRYRARLSFRLALLDEKAKQRAKPAGEPRPLLKLEGYTRDLSATGLALVVPTIRIGEHYLAGDGHILLLTLELPSAIVEMRVRTVRYEKLDEEEDASAERGYLLGVSIAEMSDEDRSGYDAYLEGIT